MCGWLAKLFSKSSNSSQPPPMQNRDEAIIESVEVQRPAANVQIDVNRSSWPFRALVNETRYVSCFIHMNLVTDMYAGDIRDSSFFLEHFEEIGREAERKIKASELNSEGEVEINQRF